MKKVIIWAVVIIIIGLGIYLFTKDSSDTVNNTQKNNQEETVKNTGEEQKPVETAPVDKTKTVIGKSVGGEDIIAYHFGEGEKEIVLVGGAHGGYSWNASLVAFEMMEYFKKSTTTIPANVKVSVIPVLNPDGLKKAVGTAGEFTAKDVTSDSEVLKASRFNGNNVDLNRNFDCDWQENAKWQAKTVSGGTEAFSEPETLAIKNYVEKNKPVAVIAWYSAAGGVFASNCHKGVSTETNDLVKKYAQASGYKAYQDFDFYETTGDMTNWLAKIEVPAISILLTNHTSTEFSKNKAGVEAVLKYYAK